MTTEPTSPPGAVDRTHLSWHERETVAALRRLANARSQLAMLEEQIASQPTSVEHDPADLERVREIQEEMERLAPKAQSRFGGASARDQVDRLVLEQRMILDRLGFNSYDEFVSAISKAPTPSADEVDPAFLEFARREVAAAEAALEQVLNLPEVEESTDEADESLPEVPDYPPAIDLTHPEAS